MASATSSRPSLPMTNSTRSTRFGDFQPTLSRRTSDERTAQATSLAQTFGNGGSWQASSGIWGNSTIGSGLVSARRDASRSRVIDNDSFGGIPSGSGALAATSEADNPWGSRSSNAPWNPTDNTSPTLPSSRGDNTSPAYVRNMPASSQSSLLDSQPSHLPSRPTIGQGGSFGSRPQSKSNLDPSSGSFKYARKPSIGYGDDKENLAHYASNGDHTYDTDINARFKVDPLGAQSNFLAIGGGSRDSSMPTSRASDAGMPGSSNGLSFSSIGHTPNSSIHSHRPSFSGLSNGHGARSNGSRYNDLTTQTDEELRSHLSGLNFVDIDRTSAVQMSNGLGPYSSSNNSFPQHHQFSGATPWNEPSNGHKTLPTYESYASGFADQSYINNKSDKAQRFDRHVESPAGSDYRNGANSPKYYGGAIVPPTGLDLTIRSREPRMPQQAFSELDRRFQSIQLAQQQAWLYNNGHFAGLNQYPLQQAFDITTHTVRQGGFPYSYPMAIPPYQPQRMAPTRPAKDHDIGAGVRSILLEEFRANTKSNRRYELKDIYNHVVEFSGDQHGSRFIQQKLETANSDEKEQLFREIQPNALQLMTDVFGNYVIQKLFEHGNQVQKRVLAETMKNHVMELSMQMYGCRVIQKALEHVLADQQAALVKELETDVLKCVKDQNGNHVVQKAIERVPVEHIRFILDAFRGQVHVLATHPYGCRVIQRILEFCSPSDQAGVLEELHTCAPMLVTDQYGNYVTQHVIENGKPEDQAKFIQIVTSQLLTLSKHKFASNVVEKSIQFGNDEQRRAIVAQATAIHSDGTSPLQLMMKDQYGNYVIQKLLAQLKGSERLSFVEAIKPQLLSLKKFNFGKQIAAIEKIIFLNAAPSHPSPSHSHLSYHSPPSSLPSTASLPSSLPSSIPSSAASLPSSSTSQSTTITNPIEIGAVMNAIGSSTTTPQLTHGQNSPQSGSLPSIEDSNHPNAPPSFAKGFVAGPEVVVNGI